jgi:hypothetical protein
MQKIGAAYPMVCFCDLPLSMAKEHIGKYGSFGIGMTKEWARRQQLNPVLYLELGSTLSEYILNQTKAVLKKKVANPGIFEAERDALTAILGFCKNHVGPLVRDGVVIDENYVFYDEREWRYLPSKDSLGDLPLGLSTTKYTEDKDGWNAKAGEHTLPFNYEDIRYIIVESEKDIAPMIKSIRDRYEPDGISAVKLNSMYTKILTVEQINNDF